jgi:hypothetical protein
MAVVIAIQQRQMSAMSRQMLRLEVELRRDRKTITSLETLLQKGR